jgi:vacuolar protein sorting-associated protein 35
MEQSENKSNKSLKLEKALQKIKEQAFHINSAIEKNNLRQCLKEAYTMLCELRTNELSPKNYYGLYMSVVDVMLTLKNYMIEEISRGRRLIDLYDDVQQAQNVIPRLYLMITAGSIYIERVPRSTRIIIYDMLGLVKAVQNPIKGLFLRNYLLKMLKDKLPDKDNIYLKEGANFEDSIKFIIENMEEMNRLWIRLSGGVTGAEKAKREKERDELKVLIGESMTKLSSLENLNLEMYEQTVLPKLLNIILNSKDKLCQQYLMECIIHAFPDSYNVKCIESLLEATSNLEQGVDIGTIFVSLMQKLGNYFGRYNNPENDENINENKEIFETAQNIYPALLKNFKGYMNQNFNNNEINTPEDINKLFNLISSFMKFSLKCAPKEQKFASVNNIFGLTLELANRCKARMSEDNINKISLLLIEPLSNGMNIFRMSDFIPLMNFLNNKNRRNLGIKLIETLITNAEEGKTNLEKLDSLDALDKILKYLKPLLCDSKDMVKEDESTYEYEQSIVCKLIYIIRTNNIEIIYKILNDLKNIFSHGGPKRRKYTLPPLALRVIKFSHDITLCYENKLGLIPEKKKKNKFVKEIIESLDISKIENDDIFYKLTANIYKLLKEILDLISQEQPELGFKLYLTSASQANSINCNKEKFQKLSISFLKNAMNIYEEGRYDNSHKYELLVQASSLLLTLNMNKEDSEEIIVQLVRSAQNMSQREEQCKSMLVISQLYFTLFKDTKNVMDCLQKARRFADFAMTNPQNLILFVEYLNKILFFIDQDPNIVEIKPEQINDLIELIRGHIRTIKSITSDDITYLNDIETYFNNTLKNIENKKINSKNKEFYSAVNIQ